MSGEWQKKGENVQIKLEKQGVRVYNMSKRRRKEMKVERLATEGLLKHVANGGVECGTLDTTAIAL